MNKPPRSEARKDFDMATRQRLLEQDMDTMEALIGSIAKDQKRMINLMVGVIISVATGGLLLALNLVVRGVP